MLFHSTKALLGEWVATDSSPACIRILDQGRLSKKRSVRGKKDNIDTQVDYIGPIFFSNMLCFNHCFNTWEQCACDRQLK